jgi:hypothetical protein
MPATSEILGKRSRALLEVSFGGEPFRFHDGSGDLVVVDGAGNEHVYQAGMGPITPETSAELRMSESIEINAQPTGTTWAREYARGTRFEHGDAVLRYHYDGQTLESARVILRGKVTSPSYGDPKEPLTFELKRRLRQSGMLPHPSMRVDPETWTGTIDPEILGATYPIIIGRPGKISGTAACPVTPALLVDFVGTISFMNKWLVAGHECFPGTVTLHDITEGTSTTATISHEKDALNRTVAVITGVGFGFALGNEYRVAWDGTAGGVLNDDRTAPIEGVAEVARYFFQRWAPSIAIDQARFISDGAELDGFKVGFALNEPDDAWSVVRGHLLDGPFPAEIGESNDGLYLRYVNLRARKTDVEWELFATPTDGRKNCERQGLIRAGSGRIINRVTIRYGVGGQDQRALRVVVLDRNDENNTDGRTLGSILATVSQEISRVGEEILLQSALPRRQIVAVGNPELDAHEVGSIGEYSEDGVHMSGELVMLRAKTIEDATVQNHLLVIDDYVLSERLTS